MFPWYIIFLKRFLVFPILLFSFISLHYLLKAFLSLLAVLWNSEFSWVYPSLSSLPSTSLLFSAICKASSDNYLAFLHFFFLGSGLDHRLLLQCLEPQSIVLQALCLPDIIPWIYILVTWLRELVIVREAWDAAVHGVKKSRTRLSDWTELNGLVVLPTFFDLSLNLTVRILLIPK